MMGLRFLSRCSQYRPLTLITAIAVLKIVVFFFLLPSFEAFLGPFYGVGFADGYDQLASNLISGNGYRFTPDTAPTLTREPGYPLLLAGIFLAFGYSLTAARLANVLFMSMAAWLISRLAREASPNRAVGLLAPALFLIHPGIVVSELRGSVEAVYILLLMFFLTATWQALRSRRLKWFLIAGITLGIASSFRSTALLFPFFLIPYFLWVERDRPPVRTMVLRLVAMFFAAFLVLSPWIVRNFTLTGTFQPTASVQGIAAHAGNYICTHWSKEKGFQTLDREAAALRADLAQQQGLRFRREYYLYFFDVNDELTFNSYLRDSVMAQYRESPTLLIKCMSRNAFNFWFAGKNSSATLANIAVQLPYMLLAAAGLVLGLRGRGRSLVKMMSLFIVYTLAVYVPIHSQARYSIAVLPALSIFAAIFLGWICERGIGNRSPSPQRLAFRHDLRSGP